MKKRVIGLAGMPGSGKSLFTQVAHSLGYEIIVMGDVIRDEAKKRAVPFTSQTLGQLMLELRRTNGAAVIAKRTISKMRALRQNALVVDGIRSLSEVREFKASFRHFVLVAIHASPKTRFTRLQDRRRGDDPLNWTTFLERDDRELTVGLGNVIAIADHLLVNHESIYTFTRQVTQVLKEVKANWTR